MEKVMYAKRESFPAFFFGMIGAVIGLIISIVMVALNAKDGDWELFVSLFLLLLPSLLIMAGAGICLKNAFVGRLLISIGAILCFIGLGILFQLYFIPIGAILVIIAQLVLLFSHRSGEEKKLQD